MNNQPYLEKYAGRKSRHECPACHDKHSFTYYLDGDTRQVIDKLVGRCDHESGCGYHYTPKEYYRDNPTREWQSLAKNGKHLSGDGFKIMQKTWGNSERDNSKTMGKSNNKALTRVNEQEPGRIPKEYIKQSLGYDSNFILFLCSIFDRYTLESPTIERLMSDYYLGCTNDKSVIYWQIDTEKRVRSGKIMQYDPETGKRIKNASGAIDWVHSKLKRDGVLPEDFNLVQTLFGAHLLNRYPDKVVVLVESEKSALIASGVYPECVWLATGGKSQLSPDKLQILKGRTVIMFPDVDGYELWSEKARELQQHGYKVMVSDVLEKNAGPEDRENKIDLADWLIRELRQVVPSAGISMAKMVPPLTEEEMVLQHLGNLNPNVYALIDALGLVSASTGEKLRTQID